MALYAGWLRKGHKGTALYRRAGRPLFWRQVGTVLFGLPCAFLATLFCARGYGGGPGRSATVAPAVQQQEADSTTTAALPYGKLRLSDFECAKTKNFKTALATLKKQLAEQGKSTLFQGKNKSDLRRLVNTLIERQIMANDTLYGCIARVDKDLRADLIDRLQYFFEQVDPSDIFHTRYLSDALATKEDLERFVDCSKKVLKQSSELDCLGLSLLLNAGLGFPSQEYFIDMIKWPCFHDNNRFSWDIFTSIVSLYRGQGVPRESDIVSFLQWPCWQLKGQFDSALFFAIATMFTGKRIPPKEAIEAFLNWSCWQGTQEGRALLLAVAVMQSGLGLPTREAVDQLLSWPYQKAVDTLDMRTVTAIAACCSGRGLPSVAEVEKVLEWPCWYDKYGFKNELFESILALSAGRGFPTHQQVQEILTWDHWQLGRTYDVAALQRFAFVHYSRGLPGGPDAVEQALNFACPTKGQANPHVAPERPDWTISLFDYDLQQRERIAAVMRWLTADGAPAHVVTKRLKLLTKGSQVLPHAEALRACEKTLQPLCKACPTCGQKELKSMVRVITLLLAQYGFNELDISNCLLFSDLCDVVPRLCSSDARLTELETVLTVHGPSGLDTCLAMLFERQDSEFRARVIDTVTLDVPLQMIDSAQRNIPPDDWITYLFFCKNRGDAVVDHDQWKIIKASLTSLSKSLGCPLSQRHYLDSLSVLPAEEWERYCQPAAVTAIFSVFSTAIAFGRTVANQTPDAVRAIVDACRRLQQNHADPEALMTLLKPMLQQRVKASFCGVAPPNSLADHIIANEPRGGVTLVRPKSVASSQCQLLHFVAALLDGLQQRNYSCDGHVLTIERGEAGTSVFPLPELSLVPAGIAITNWGNRLTTEVFHAIGRFDELFKSGEPVTSITSTPDPLADQIHTESSEPNMGTGSLQYPPFSMVHQEAITISPPPYTELWHYPDGAYPFFVSDDESSCLPPWPAAWWELHESGLAEGGAPLGLPYESQSQHNYTTDVYTKGTGAVDSWPS